jgi:DNA-binding FrmR family transcriptional regulator
MQETCRKEVLKRLSYAGGHLTGVRKMVQEDKYCIDIVRQTFAIRKALEKLEVIIVKCHLQTCVPNSMNGGNEEELIQELLQLYRIAGNH